MNLLKQPNRWSCLITSYAMVLDKPINDLIKLVGHDGSDILWPTKKEPLRRKGFHHHELQYVARGLGFYMVDYKPSFRYSPSPECEEQKYFFTFQWKEVLRRHNGILSGRYLNASHGHAVAWNADEGIIYDPTGHLSRLDDFIPLYFHAAICAGNGVTELPATS